MEDGSAYFSALTEASGHMGLKMQLKSEDPFDYESHDPRRMYSFESSRGAVEVDDAKFQQELVEADQFIPLPRQILSLYRQVHNASYMGILPEINRAWITIDNRLYLWNYENPEQYTEYEGLDDSDVIVSVALSAPKPGIFLDNVQYVLVVATLSEVCLFAVTKDSCKLLRTAYSVPSEGVIYKAAGSQAGIVFLAGSDGSLSELDYSADQSIWSLLDLSSSSSSSSSSDRASRGGRDNCRLVRHGHWDSSLLRFVPAFMRPPETALELRDALSETVVDNFRQILYCVSGQGSLSAFHTHTLQQGRGKKQLRRVGGSGKVFAVLDMARVWLEQSLGLEGYATDKGKQPQQGMEEEEEEHSSRGRLFKACFAAPSSSTPLRVVGLHVLPVVESAEVHAVMTANNGTRVLLQLRSAQGNAMDGGRSQDCPSSVAVVAVYPPPASIPATSGSRTGSSSSGALDGFVHRTFSASGVFIAASIASRSNCSALLGAVHSTRLLPVVEDKGSDTDEDEKANNSGEDEEKEGSVAAGVVASSSRRGSGKQSRQGSRQELIGSVPAPLNSVVRDIKEDCRAYRLPASDLLQRALLTSNTITTHNTAGAGGNGAPLGVNQLLSLAPSLRGGDTNSNSNNQQSHAHAGDVLRPGELDLQCYMHPSPGGLGQRRFLCLESQGMHVLVKQRPVDRVLGVLTGALPLPEEEAAAASHHQQQQQQQQKGQSSRIGFGFGSDPLDRENDRSGISKVSTSTRAVRALVDQYGAVEFVCMCISLGCGLPADARLTTQRDVSALAPTEENLRDPQRFREHTLPAFLATTHLLRGPVLSQQQGSGAPAFVPSQLSDGIVLFLSRALRPLWGQPMLTPARDNNNKKPSLNALWNPDVLSAALAPLEALQVMLEQYFPHALGTVPRTAAQREELLRRYSSESSSGNSDSTSSHSAANVARELEHSHLACVYRLVARCRELVHVLLLVVIWQQQQQHILHNCVNELRVAAAEAAEKGIVDPLSMPLALRRDQLARRVERRKALARAFDWPQLAVWAADATFSSVATDHEHAAQFTSVLRLGLHEVCVVEQEQGQEPDSEQAVAVAVATEQEHEQPLGADGLAESIASCASGYFTEADLHEFAAFRLLHNHLSTTTSKGNTRPAEGEAVLPPALAGHLLAAAESWSTLGSVRDRAGQDSLLGAHAALLSDVGSDDALELAVQLCLAAARNFLPPSAPANNTEVTEAAAARLEQGALACYSHLITLVCATAGISLNQRAGMLMIAIEDQWLGGDPRLLETVCAGLRGRFTDDLLLNLPSEYVSQYLRRNDRSLLFQWHCRREEFEEACAVALEQAFEDDGSPIALRVGHLKDALSVVPEAEHATVSRMLNFALIQYDAHLKLLSGTAGATFDIKPSSKKSTTAEDATASPASGGRSRTYYYRDASPSPSQKMKHKAARGSSRGANNTPTGTTDPLENSPGALIRARGDTQELEHARYRLGFTLISEGEWYQECFSLVRGLHLWEAALCLLVLLDVDQLADPGDGEALMVRLWKSFIYRLVPTRSRDGAASQVGQFLAKQRQISEIDIDPHEQLGGGSGSGSSSNSGVMFEDYQKWLPGLQSAIQCLCQRIDGAGTNGSSSSDEEEQQQESENNHASLPMAPLLAELEAIATELDVMQCKQASGSGHATAALSQSQHGTLRGWVPDALLAVNVRPINIVRAYVNLFWSVGRGFSPEKIIKLLESLSYVLLEWLRASTADRMGSLPSTRDLRGAVGSRELDNWVDAFRHQLSDMSGRVSNEHSKAALGRVALEFQQLLRLIDEFAFE